MSNQAYRQGFLFGPTDNSSTTLTSYDQVARKWIDAFERNKPRPAVTLSGGDGLYIITLFKMFIVLVLLFIDSLIRLAQFLIKLNSKNLKPNNNYEKLERLKLEEYVRQKREQDMSLEK